MILCINTSIKSVDILFLALLSQTSLFPAEFSVIEVVLPFFNDQSCGYYLMLGVTGM